MEETAAAVQAAFDYAALFAVISLIVTTAGGLIMAWIGYKIRQLERNTNSIKDALVLTTATLNLARGKVEGRADLKREQAAAGMPAGDVVAAPPPAVAE